MVQSILAKMISSGFGSCHKKRLRDSLDCFHRIPASCRWFFSAEVIPVTSSVCAKCAETWKPGDRLATGPSGGLDTGGWCNQ